MSDVSISPTAVIETTFEVDGRELTDEFYPLCGGAVQLSWADATLRVDSTTKRVTASGSD